MKINRREEALLVRMLQESEEGKALPEIQAAPSQAAELRDHLDTWDRLGSLRPSNPDPSHVAAGRERMFSALFASGLRRRRRSRVSLMNSVLKLPAALAGVLVLTGAATGASVAVGGPDIWSSVGVNRSNEAAMERSDAIEANLDVTDSQAAPVSAGDAGESLASETGSDDAGTIPGEPAIDDAGESSQGDVYVNEEEGESSNDGIASAAEPSGGADLSGAAASSAPEDDDGEDGDDISADAATPR